MSLYNKFLSLVIIISFLIISTSYIYDNKIISKAKNKFIETDVTAQGKNSQSNDNQLLARCVNGEARGESYLGQVAVAAVILNRVKHPSFPKTLSGVIYQPRAFTAVNDGQINVPLDTNSQVYKACREALNGTDPTNGAIYYYNPAKTTNKWIFSRKVVKTIGKHKFAL